MQRAEEDRTGSVLNLIKAIKEIQGMDLAQMEQGLRIVQSIEGEQQDTSRQEPQRSVA
jgi:hypothetical protein